MTEALFLWGAATAGHQVEGSNVNADIWLLEQVAGTSFVAPSGDACDSLNRWRDDVALVAGLGLNAYRFSVEWSRIEPAAGQFSEARLDHYVRIADACRTASIEPVLPLSASLNAVLRQGVPVIGYCHWSLLDDFEWRRGYTQQFGLHAVDRPTFRRTAKPSAGVYASIMATRK